MKKNRNERPSSLLSEAKRAVGAARAPAEQVSGLEGRARLPHGRDHRDARAPGTNPLRHLSPSEPHATPTVFIEPAQTRMNGLHYRSASTLEGRGLEALVRDIRVKGQVVPALGYWLVPPEDAIKIELVYGARRREAALRLGVPLKVAVLPKKPSRLETMRWMHAENSARQDYQPLEEARELAAILASGEFASASDMATALGLEPSRVSRVLTLLTLPQEVLALYREPRWLKLMNGVQLAIAVRDSAAVRQRVMAVVALWSREGRRSDPSTALKMAMRDRDEEQGATVSLKVTRQRSAGHVRTHAGNGALTVVLTKHAPPEVKEKITQLLREAFPRSGL